MARMREGKLGGKICVPRKLWTLPLRKEKARLFRIVNLCTDYV